MHIYKVPLGGVPLAPVPSCLQDPHSLDVCPCKQAMGENLHDEVAGEPESLRERRLKLIAAVEGDDWSEVIQQQTAETAVGGLGVMGMGMAQLDCKCSASIMLLSAQHGTVGQQFANDFASEAGNKCCTCFTSTCMPRRASCRLRAGRRRRPVLRRSRHQSLRLPGPRCTVLWARRRQQSR